MSARSSSVASHQVAITRRGTTRACPGLTGKRSAMTNAERFAASHSEAGTARNGESPLGNLAPRTGLWVDGHCTLRRDQDSVAAGLTRAARLGWSCWENLPGSSLGAWLP